MTFLVLPRIVIDTHIHETNKLNVLVLGIYAFINKLLINFVKTIYKIFKNIYKNIILYLYTNKNICIQFNDSVQLYKLIDSLLSNKF